MILSSPRIIRVCEIITAKGNIQVLFGLELTHVDPADIVTLVSEARKLGAKILIVHGETLTEPVPPGTNLAAIQAGADILAHPGLITEEEGRLAASKGVYLEITTQGTQPDRKRPRCLRGQKMRRTFGAQ